MNDGSANWQNLMRSNSKMNPKLEKNDVILMVNSFQNYEFDEFLFQNVSESDLRKERDCWWVVAAPVPIDAERVGARRLLLLETAGRPNRLVRVRRKRIEDIFVWFSYDCWVLAWK